MDPMPILPANQQPPKYPRSYTPSHHDRTPEVISPEMDMYVSSLELDSVADLTEEHKDGLLRADLGVSLADLKAAFEIIDGDDIMDADG